MEHTTAPDNTLTPYCGSESACRKNGGGDLDGHGTNRDEAREDPRRRPGLSRGSRRARQVENIAGSLEDKKRSQRDNEDRQRRRTAIHDSVPHAALAAAPANDERGRIFSE